MDVQIYFPDNFKTPLRGENLRAMLNKGDVLTARVDEVASDGKAKITLFGRTFEIEIPPSYKEGDAVRLSVKESGGRLILEVVQDSVKPGAAAARAEPSLANLLAEAGLKDTPENRAAFQALVRAGVPATAENVGLVLKAAAGAGIPAEEGMHAASYILKNGLPLGDAFVRGAANLLADGTALAETLSGLADKAGSLSVPGSAETIQQLQQIISNLFTAADAAGVENAAGAGFAAQVAAAQQAVEQLAATALANSEIMNAIDVLRSAFGTDMPAAPGESYTAEQAVELLRRMFTRGPVEMETARFIMQHVAAGEREAFSSMLATLESEFAAKDARLGPLGEMHRELGALLERSAVMKAVSIASQTGGERLTFSEIVYPALVNGQVVRLKFSSRKQKDEKKKQAGGGRRVKLDVETSALGRVLGEITAGEKNVRVEFDLEEEKAVKLFEKNRDALGRRIGELDFAAEIIVRLIARCNGLFCEELSAGPGDIRIIDVEA